MVGDAHVKIAPLCSHNSQYHAKYESVDFWSWVGENKKNSKYEGPLHDAFNKTDVEYLISMIVFVKIVLNATAFFKTSVL